MSIEWHLDEELARRFADGRVTPALAAGVEQHLIRCADCRGMLHGDPQRLDRVFGQVLQRIEAPRRTLLERLLTRLGVSPATARLVAATPSLRSAWLCGVAVVLALTLLVAHQEDTGAAVFLILAPVLPVVGVAFAFGPATDPTHEVAATAPYSAVRLLAVRTVVVVASTCVPALAAGALLPGSAWLSFAWLLPALALTVATLALSTRFPPHAVAVGLVTCWTAVMLHAWVRLHDPLLVPDARVQLASLACCAAAGGVLLTQRHDLQEIFRRNP